MVIAIPIVDGKLCMHFGHSERFALAEVDWEGKRLVKVETVVPPPHEPGVLPRWLHELGAEVIVAGGMGMRAQQLFTQNGIRVIVGAPSETPETIVRAFLAGTLETGANVCDH